MRDGLTDHEQSAPVDAELTQTKLVELLRKAEAEMKEREKKNILKPKRLMLDDEYLPLFHALHCVRWVRALTELSAADVVYRHDAFGAQRYLEHTAPTLDALQDESVADDNISSTEIQDIFVDDDLVFESFYFDTIRPIRLLLREAVVRGHAFVVSLHGERLSRYKLVLNCGFGGRPAPMQQLEFEETFERVKKFLVTQKLSPDGFIAYRALCGKERPFGPIVSKLTDDLNEAQEILKRNPDLDRFLAECFDRNELSCEFGLEIRGVRFSSLVDANEVKDMAGHQNALRKENTLHTKGTSTSRSDEADVQTRRIAELEDTCERAHLSERAARAEAERLRARLRDSSLENAQLRLRLRQLEADLTSAPTVIDSGGEVVRLRMYIAELERIFGI